MSYLGFLHRKSCRRPYIQILLATTDKLWREIDSVDVRRLQLWPLLPRNGWTVLQFGDSVVGVGDSWPPSATSSTLFDFTAVEHRVCPLDKTS